MWGEITLVTGKDLRIERRSRVGLTQIAPFAVTVLVLFGFALEGDSATLRRFTAGLFWVAVVFTAILAVQRSFTVESANDNRDALRLSGLDPIAIFLGKASALVIELLVLEVVLGFVVAVLYGGSVHSPALLAVTAVVATIAVAAAGTIYGVLAASLRVRETILPLLLLPVLAPVLIAATRAFEDALGEAAVNGWSWLVLLSLTAVVYTAFGALAFGTLLEGIVKTLGERDELRSTSSRGTRILGGLSIVGVVVLALAGLWWSPEDRDMGDLVRIMYVHVPSAWLAYMAFIITAIGSVMFLWKRSVWWDLMAGASAEIGVLFCALALATGSLWGRPTWGTYWLWSDVRIVTTLVLLLMYAGYLALRRVDGDPTQRSKRAAIVGLIAAANIPVVRYSVDWWSNRTLHQKDTVGLDTKLDNGPLFTLMFGLVVFTVLFAWMLLHRFRIAWLESETEHRGLEQALIERRAEGRATLGAAEVRP